ncbi:TolC family outer membrane protein [Alkalilimnicola ehrlichii]|uniref:Type I secretion outer membrane protein, TolC family n=1 Tax=Alkalilimnicola ehrlichii TaxID=351052 RepID=A0A3E0WNP0_9GAMM|nr:TolC family outer membrane protein [Alkalilimnicola ehrlichii]RFA34590.1 hypothetical protein CAL65_14585 [Alkalilimnicola ehrlichii]
MNADAGVSKRGTIIGVTIKCCFSLAVALALLVGSPAQAQRADLLTLYRLAEERDPQLAAAREQRRAQQEQVPLARSNLLPQISASANANRVWEDTQFGDSPPPQEPGAAPMMGEGDASYNTANIGISVNQVLFRQEAFIALRQARIVDDLADAEFLSVNQQLALRVADAYFAVLEAEDAVRSFEAELETVEHELQRAERRYELGVGAITEVNDARARYAATRASLLQARSQVRLAGETLRRTVNAPVSAVFRLPEGFEPERPQPDAPSAWAELAERQSVEVRLSELSLDVAQAGVDVARSERYPRLDLVANLQRDYQGENPMAGGGSMETDRASIGIQLSVPLYTGGGISAGARQALAERETAFHQLLDARRNAALQAESAFIALESSLEQIGALVEALQAARLSEDSTERGLELGQRTTLDLLNVQRERFQVERDLAAARYEYLLAYIELYTAVGRPVEETLAQVNALLARE